MFGSRCPCTVPGVSPRLAVGRRPAGAALCALALLCAAAPGAGAAAPTEPPSGLAVTEATARTLRVEWDAAPAGLSLRMSVSEAGSATAFDVRELGGAQGFATVTVACGRTYVVELRLHDDLDETGPPASATRASAPCTPGPPHAPANVQVGTVFGGGIFVTWDAPAVNDIKEIAIAARRAAAPWGDVTSRVAWNLTGATVRPLVCGTTYGIDVTFVDEEGQSATTTVPGPVTTRACAELGPEPAPPASLRIVPKDFYWLTWPLPPPEGVAGMLVTAENARLPAVTGVADPRNAYHPAWPRLPCGPITATGRWLYEDGRLSAPATATATLLPCPNFASTATPGEDVIPIALRLPAQRRPITLGADRRFTLRGARVRCASAGGSCVARVRVVRAGRRGVRTRLGTATVTVAQGAWLTTLRGRLSPAGGSLVRRLGRVKVAIEVEVEQAVGNDAADVRATLVAPSRPSGR